jgi:hypothetical protein
MLTMRTQEQFERWGDPREGRPRAHRPAIRMAYPDSPMIHCIRWNHNEFISSHLRQISNAENKAGA